MKGVKKKTFFDKKLFKDKLTYVFDNLSLEIEYLNNIGVPLKGFVRAMFP